MFAEQDQNITSTFSMAVCVWHVAKCLEAKERAREYSWSGSPPKGGSSGKERERERKRDGARERDRQRERVSKCSARLVW